MAVVSRLMITGAWCAGLFMATLAGPAQAQNVAPVSDLSCPNAAPAPKFTASRPAGSVSMAGNQMPSDAELGPLARTTVREQPALDAQSVAGFAVGNGASRRLALWGDSHIAGGPFMATMMGVLRDKGLTVAPQFLPPTMGRANVVLPGLRAFCIGSSWSTEIAYTSPNALDIGPALANRTAEAGAESYLWLDLRDGNRQANVRQVNVVYGATNGATLAYSIDDGPVQNALLKSAGGSQLLTLQASRAISTLKLRVSQGKLTLYGFKLDAATPPAVGFDVFGLPSSTVKGWANANPAFIKQALSGVSYDGVVLEYGTNEGADADFDSDKYTAMLSKALTNMRTVFPDASCVLVGPPDRGVLRQGKRPSQPLLQYSRVHQQIENVQRDVGRRFGCAAWSWQGLMGGPGGSYGWAHAQPSMMGRDLIHLSPDGYRRTGRALAHSLGWSP